MILFPYTMLFFVLISIAAPIQDGPAVTPGTHTTSSEAAPTSNKQKIITPDSYSLGQVFYTASSSWDNVNRNAYLPVIVVGPPHVSGATHVGVVEMAIEMEWLEEKQEGKVLKVPANQFFPPNAKISIGGSRDRLPEGVLISKARNIWINVSKLRIVPIKNVQRPRDRLVATVTDEFLSRYGYKLVPRRRPLVVHGTQEVRPADHYYDHSPWQGWVSSVPGALTPTPVLVVGKVFYADSVNWDQESPNKLNIPVVVIELPPNGDAKVKVVEIMIEMKYFQAESEQKVLAKEFFREQARLSIATVLEPGALLSKQNNIWINTCTPRNILVASLKEPKLMVPPRRSAQLEIEKFLDRFGSKLGITGYVDSKPPSPEPPTTDTPSENEGRQRTVSNPVPPMAVIPKERQRSASDPFN